MWPFLTQAVCTAFAIVLIWRIALRGPIRDTGGAHIRRDIADGIRWLLRHPPVRTLALVIFAFNITWGAGWSSSCCTRGITCIWAKWASVS